MSFFVPTVKELAAYTFANGAECRARHPSWLDEAQQYLVAGFPWATPAARLLDDVGEQQVLWVPYLLRPWCEFLAVGLRAVVTDAASSVTLQLLAADGITVLSLTDIVLGPEDLTTVAAVPTTQQEWNAYPWCAAGSVGWVVPPATGKGALQVSPVNAWTRTFLKLTLGLAAVNDLAVRPFASALQLVAGGP
jgi:hypothetical protein